MRGIISDLRGVDPIYSGNRFMIYSMYPEQNISAWIVNGRGGHGCSVAVGYSIINKTATLDVGAEAGARVHQESDQNPSLRVQDFLDGQVAGIHLLP